MPVTGGYISNQTSIFAPASEKQKMILESDAQILVVGGAAGSGKSYLLQLLPLFITDDPNTNCICFRRTVPMLRGQGGVYDTALSIYNQLPVKLRPKNRDKEMEFKFPSGAKVKFMGMEYEKDKINIQGLNVAHHT